MMADDEKSRFSHQGGQVGGGAVDRASSVRTTRTATNAPRLSLRPVTQFQPDLANEKGPSGSSRAAGVTGANANVAARSPSANLVVPGAQVNGANESLAMNPTIDPTNPFGSHAETSSHVVTGLSPPPPVGAGNRTTAWPSSFSNPELQGKQAESGLQAKAVESGTGVGMVDPAIGATVMAASQRPETPTVQEMTGKAAPNGDSFTTSAAPSALNQQGPGTVESNILAAMPVPLPSPQSTTTTAPTGGNPRNAPVHRVQMDFKPSMADELALRVGQLVRILHEYDDGWVCSYNPPGGRISY